MILAGSVYKWNYNRNYNTFYNNGTIEARSNWEVHMHRTYFNIKYDYQRDNCLRDGGRLTATRCYYPENFYVKLTRKLAIIELNELKFNNYSIFSRSTSYNKYGTKGITAGTLTEQMIYTYDVEDIEDFPHKYIISYKPKDITKYKLVFKVDLLKGMNLPVGNYTDSEYVFENIKIKVPEEFFDYMEVLDDNTIKFYFIPQVGDQIFNIELIDPIIESELPSVEWSYIYDGDKIVGVIADGIEYTSNFNVNEAEGYLYVCSVPVGDRNWEEYPMRQYEIDKGVCRKIDLLK